MPETRTNSASPESMGRRKAAGAEGLEQPNRGASLGLS